jgi:hypothetical protein
VEKSSPKIWPTSVIFNKTSQSKQLPNRRKFAQSGHSVSSGKKLEISKYAATKPTKTFSQTLNVIFEPM